MLGRCRLRLPGVRNFRPALCSSVYTFNVRAITGSSGQAENASSEQQATKPAKGAPVDVSEFKQLTPFIKRVVLRVHPDIVATAAAEVVDTNADSLQELFKLFDGLKVYCEAPDVSAITKEPQLKPRYRLSFYHYEQVETADTELRPLKMAAVDISIPALLIDRCRILARKGMHAQARARWMAKALEAVQACADGLGLKFPLQLAKQHADLIVTEKAQQESAAKASQAAWASAEGMMQTNLLHFSPLVQGKGQKAFPGIEHVNADREAPSVYSSAERRRRAEQILSRKGCVSLTSGLSQTAARDAVNRLRQAFTDLHDPLQAYHPVWNIITLNITAAVGPSGVGGYLGSPSTYTLALPADFTRQGLLKLVASHVPAMIAQQMKGKKANMVKKKDGSASGQPAKAQKL